ncbi:MAG TPA: retron St85 family effector protein [Pyrinomonadaceae bacterium]|nr:retron St85 family effector protein [Pyrinomonadaceae bacterium]
MAQLFSNKAGLQLLASLRKIFEEKKIYHRKDRFIIFVCGGKLEEGGNSLRKQFVEWAKHNLPEFVCLLAEDALKDNFVGEGRTFVNLAKFESVIADVADCVLIFPESAGSFAETGFFANSPIREKTLIVNPFDLQIEDSFLNLGPIDTISTISLLKPTVLINVKETVDFTPIGQRLKERVKWPEYRERLPYQKFGQFSFKQKLLVVFEVLRLLRLAELKTLRHALVTCFGGNPRNQELKHLLRILLAAKFIERDGEFFRVVAGLKLIEIEHLEIEKVFAQVNFFYQTYSKDLYEALPEVGR